MQPCLVKDMSDTGARLDVTLLWESRQTGSLLQLAPDGSVGRRCEVRWRNGREIGVKFVARILKARREQVGIPDR
jgi:hypothetical protein